MSVTLQAFVLAIALASVSAQDTVNSESGLTYACSKDPSAIPAFINNLCPSSVTSRQGTTWGLRGSRVQAVYINAPTDYHSTQPSDILVSCSWSEPDNDGVFYECEYTAGTGGLVKVTSSNAGGPDSSGQTCPTIAATKPQPSPGTDYRKRQTSAPKFACASTQVGGDNYLVLAARSTFTAEYLDSESTCEYALNKGTDGFIYCYYDDDGVITSGSTACPSQQCAAVDPYTDSNTNTKRRRGAPQPADKRQTSRQRIVARQRELSFWGS